MRLTLDTEEIVEAIGDYVIKNHPDFANENTVIRLKAKSEKMQQVAEAEARRKPADL